MADLFVPYKKRKPATVSINGHTLVILAHESSTLSEEMDLLGADRIRSVHIGNDKIAVEKMIGKIAREIDGGVVIAPAEVNLKDVLKNLESELPWVQ